MMALLNNQEQQHIASLRRHRPGSAGESRGAETLGQWIAHPGGGAVMPRLVLVQVQVVGEA
jgi:hypothetical protein